MKLMAGLENRFWRSLLVVWCLAGGAACSFPVPERYAAPHTYILTADSLKGMASSAGSAFPRSSNTDQKPVLLVNQPRDEAGFDTPRMVYLLRPHEISYYAENQWVDTPAQMLAPILVQAMEKSELWKSVIQTRTTIQADYRLDAENLSLQQQFFSRPSRVRLALKLQLVELKGRQMIASRDFEIWEDAPSDDAYGGVVASNRAVAEMLQQSTNWLNAIMNKATQAQH